MYLYYPHTAKQLKKRHHLESKTYIKPASFLLENELMISSKLVSIPDFSRHFLPILSNKKLFLSQMGEHIPDFIPLQEHASFYSIVIQDTSNYLPFNKGIISFPSFLYSLRYLLNSIQLAIDNHIVHGNICPEAILFTPSLIPLFKDFSHSIDFSKERKSIPNPRATYLPLEAHAVQFILEKNLASLSSENIDAIVGRWALSSFPKDIINQFREAGISALEKYKNRGRDTILSALFSSWNTWDCYSLSLLYYSLLKSMYPLQGENPCLGNLCTILIQNMDPESNKRNSIAETLYKIDSILDNTEKEDLMYLMTTSLS
jgi:hypothetical protein